MDIFDIQASTFVAGNNDCDSTVTEYDIDKELKYLVGSKAPLDFIIPLKIIKAHIVFLQTLHPKFDSLLKPSRFPHCMKIGNIKSIFEESTETDKANIGQLVYYQFSRKR